MPSTMILAGIGFPGGKPAMLASVVIRSSPGL
jgi:hypothetical protein